MPRIALEQLRRQVIDVVDERRSQRIATADPSLLGVGQRERSEGEHLIHLGGVAELCVALRRELWVVVQDDRRCQYQVACVGGPGQHREAAHLLVFRDVAMRPFGGIDLGHKRSVLRSHQQVRRYQ
jgi:hypothetical protein